MELLSPAGNLELALAAFDGGADAVYCGLGRFNARERAENFTVDALGRLLRFSREHGKRVYVTFNTIIFENELDAMIESLAQLARFRPDALIVQDPGVARTVREYFPELVLHGSTQMGVHNSAGLLAAARMGFRRVILERQMTLDEIEAAARNSPVELELFVHGSLCCSLSGRCLLSSVLLGASGNRGQCRQLCRKRYRPEGKKPGFWLSPADLAAGALLERFRAAGIASLKIEGRLRTPDYVWKTARAYRLLLDSPDRAEAADEAAALLRSAVGRSPGTAFYDAGNWKRLIDPERSGVFGETAATVLRVLRRGVLAEVRTSLHLGDRLRIAAAGESFSLTAMERDRGVRLLRARAGDRVFLPGEFRAAPGDPVLRIGENGFDFSRRAAALPEFQQPLAVRVTAEATGFSGTIDGVPGVWTAATDFAAAEKRPLDAETVRAAFASGVPAGFVAETVTADVRGGFFVPAAALKELRRAFWAFFAPKLAAAELRPDIPEKLVRFALESSRAVPTAPVEVPPDAAVIPAFIPEGELPEARKRLLAAYRRGCRDFVVTHWHGFTLGAELSDVRLYAAFPFPVANSLAARAAAELGAVAAEIEPETPPETADALTARSVLPLYRSGRPVPLLVTRLPLPPGRWRDEENRTFRVETESGLTCLYSD